MPQSYDLTDSDTVKAFARVRRADADADPRITLLISAFSKAIGRYTGRQWLGKAHGINAGTEVATAKTYSYDGNGYLSLAPYEARDITQVKLDGKVITATAAGEQMESDEYVAEPRQKTTEATFLYLLLPRLEEKDTPHAVEVTAKWGIWAVDPDVELACLHAVADAYRNPEGVAQRDIGDGLTLGEDADENGGSLPRAARALLTPFRRP